MSIDYFNGKDTTVYHYEFQENGSSIPINKNNVQLYIQYVAQFYLQESIKQASFWIQKGIRDVLGRTDFSLFDGVCFNSLFLYLQYTFQLLLSGDSVVIDIEDMKENTNIINPDNLTEYEDWFWSVMEEFSNDEKSRFLLFATGIGRPPLNGFKHLEPRVCFLFLFFHQLVVRFYRNRDGYDDNPRLPTSHTCLNEIVIPYYENKDLLKKNLLLSIYETGGYDLS